MGKSRLGWEFEKYVDGLAAEVWWHRGRCLSYGEGVAFWALAEIVRQRLGIAEEDPAEVAAAKLAAGLEQFISDPGERAYIGTRLGRLLGVASTDGGATLGQAELFAGWRLFFERLAAQSPVVLVVEDAQYADGGLLDFLDHLIDWVRDLPVYVLAFARPELAPTRPGPCGSRQTAPARRARRVRGTGTRYVIVISGCSLPRSWWIRSVAGRTSSCSRCTSSIAPIPRSGWRPPPSLAGVPACCSPATAECSRTAISA